MNIGYSILIAMTCLVPVLVNLMWLKPKKSDTDAQTQSFEDFVLGFETKFVQIFYEATPNLQSISPQSTLIILLIVGFVAPPNISNELHEGIGLQRMNFDDLSSSRETLYKGVALLRNRSQELRSTLGWSWQMINNRTADCVVQDRLMTVLKLLNASDFEISEKLPNIGTVVKESFTPKLKRFQVACIKKVLNNDTRTLVVNNLFTGRVRSLGNINYFMLTHRYKHHNLSLTFLNPANISEMNTMMEQFSKFDARDLRMTKDGLHRRSYMQVPYGAWIHCRDSSELRPFLSQSVTTFRKTNQLVGDFNKFCIRNVTEKRHVYHVSDHVKFNFNIDPGKTGVKACDENDELRRKTETDSVELKYPFVILIILDKSIIYASAVKNELP